MRLFKILTAIVMVLAMHGEGKSSGEPPLVQPNVEVTVDDGQGAEPLELTPQQQKIMNDLPTQPTTILLRPILEDSFGSPLPPWLEALYRALSGTGVLLQSQQEDEAPICTLVCKDGNWIVKIAPVLLSQATQIVEDQHLRHAMVRLAAFVQKPNLRIVKAVVDLGVHNPLMGDPAPVDPSFVETSTPALRQFFLNARDIIRIGQMYPLGPYPPPSGGEVRAYITEPGLPREFHGEDNLLFDQLFSALVPGRTVSYSKGVAIFDQTNPRWRSTGTPLVVAIIDQFHDNPPRAGWERSQAILTIFPIVNSIGYTVRVHGLDPTVGSQIPPLCEERRMVGSYVGEMPRTVAQFVYYLLKSFRQYHPGDPPIEADQLRHLLTFCPQGFQNLLREITLRGG
ncbi:MAG: hypothetical protein LBJ92_00505 [Holosporales bacterium]|jgi:hypothetical protein|nr:hypothetical protein [Holosporales bacterium]